MRHRMVAPFRNGCSGWARLGDWRAYGAPELLGRLPRTEVLGYFRVVPPGRVMRGLVGMLVLRRGGCGRNAGPSSLRSSG